MEIVWNISTYVLYENLGIFLNHINKNQRKKKLSIFWHNGNQKENSMRHNLNTHQSVITEHQNSSLNFWFIYRPLEYNKLSSESWECHRSDAGKYVKNTYHTWWRALILSEASAVTPRSPGCDWHPSHEKS